MDGYLQMWVESLEENSTCVGGKKANMRNLEKKMIPDSILELHILAQQLEARV